MSMTGRRDMTRLRSVRTSTGESQASITETMRSSRSELLMMICESPVQPTMRVSRWRTGMIWTRCSSSAWARRGLSSRHSRKP
jgi:hypothetical protein